MWRAITAAAVMVMILGTAPPRAASAPGFRFGVDVTATVPFLEWQQSSGVGIGLLAYGAFTALPVVDLTVRAGYIGGFQHGPKSMQHLPLLLGVKAYPVRALGLYAAVEAGPVWNGRTVSGEAQGFKTEWGATGGVGFTFGPVDGRVAAFLPDLVHADEMIGLMLTMGYRW